ncbi:DUF6153 family protein [Streptomyces sp. NBC_00838]|uniref:DUF6153 family protein n=1 Tax=Streptomyces sp. NBC_00838 TaxID=2903680 RepID=UPI0038699AC7|nr:DUF6153 family protein [Streptomyces sp. NBC_00838]
MTSHRHCDVQVDGIRERASRPGSNSSRNRRGSTTGARLLLVAVLAVGLFAMHTLGHPDEAYGPGADPMTHASAEAAPSPGRPLPHPAPAGEQVMGMDGMGMDMASLCVAVLGTWALSAPLPTASARRPGALTGALAGLAVEPRPNSPPRTPDLASLSVLRI